MANKTVNISYIFIMGHQLVLSIKEQIYLTTLATIKVKEIPYWTRAHLILIDVLKANNAESVKKLISVMFLPYCKKMLRVQFPVFFTQNILLIIHLFITLLTSNDVFVKSSTSKSNENYFIIQSLDIQHLDMLWDFYFLWRVKK